MLKDSDYESHDDYFKTPDQFQTILDDNDVSNVQIRQQLQQKKLLEFQQMSKLQHVGSVLPIDEIGELKSQELSTRYIGQRFAALQQIQQKQHYQNQLEQQYENKSFMKANDRQYSHNINEHNNSFDCDYAQLGIKSSEFDKKIFSDPEKSLNLPIAHKHNISHHKKATLDFENNNISIESPAGTNKSDEVDDITRSMFRKADLNESIDYCEKAEDLSFEAEENSEEESNDNKLDVDSSQDFQTSREDFDENEVRTIYYAIDFDVNIILQRRYLQRVKLIDNYTAMQAQTATAKTHTSIRHGVGIQAFDSYDRPAISTGEFDIVESSSYITPSKLFKFLLGSYEPKTRREAIICIEGLWCSDSYLKKFVGLT